jgi:hypothetical protein
VGRFAEFHCATDELTNPVPITAIVVLGPKRGAPVGEMDEMLGTGLVGGEGGGLCHISAIPPAMLPVSKLH